MNSVNTMANIEHKNKIKEYWNDRVIKQPDLSATTNDVFLRELEILTTINTIKQIGHSSVSTVLDIGCADGYFTINVAKAFPKINFLGIDYSENMIKHASTLLNSYPDLKKRVNFLVGDGTKLAAVCKDKKFDLILSDRFLINLESKESQYSVIKELHKYLKSSGYYLAIESFIDGHKNMNNARSYVGLPEIPLRWHNLFLKKEEFTKKVSPFFDILEIKNFASSYYFATRIIYSKMCYMHNQQPDYNHDIHKLAINLPWVGDFSPVRMAVMKKRKKSKYIAKSKK